VINRLLILLALLWLSAVPLPLAAYAQPRQRCFSVNSECLTDPILSYWERHGGLSAFGYPVSRVRLETAEGRTLRMQWFERDRLEIQSDGTVTGGRLGARWLELQGRPWETFPTVARAEPNCAYFVVTQHQVCEPFLRYWKTQGGLEQFGYPISEPLTEQGEGRGYAVQYFERRRMEYHPELIGTRYQILLGLLGANLAETDSCIPLDERFEPTAYAYRNVLGCPLAPSREQVGSDRIGLRGVPLAVERFERGMMLWTRQFSTDVMAPPSIFVITPDSNRQALAWQEFPDTWSEGQPTGVVDRPPNGLYAPVRGIGYLWANNPELRARLGCAIEPEHGETGGYRVFSKGFMLYRPSTARLFLFTSDGIVREVPVV
jgi:hypothetical protein